MAQISKRTKQVPMTTYESVPDGVELVLTEEEAVGLTTLLYYGTDYGTLTSCNIHDVMNKLRLSVKEMKGIRFSAVACGRVI